MKISHASQSLTRGLFSSLAAPTVSQLPIPLPQLSPSMKSGRISCWKVREGDHVKAEQILYEYDALALDFVLFILDANHSTKLAKS